jgi:hypothetical protein
MRVLVAATTLLCACGPEPTFTNVREKVFEPRCSARVCHGGTDPKADLGLVDDPYAALVDVPSDVNPDRTRVVPGDPDKSVLYRVLVGDDPDVDPMPDGLPAGALDDAYIEMVRQWIERGAPDD